MPHSKQSARRGTTRLLPLAALALFSTGCSKEMGRRINDTDVSCLRAQMSGESRVSFPIAANTCQRMSNGNLIFGAKNAKPIPLNLKDAPDLQAQAAEYGYTYTR
ncbi:hypothetical protein [Acetobacter sp. DsW_063]|uniref:hypothetical protein n=2 Tax=Acetobacter TaxID=434 RepID=UPI0035150A9C